MAKSEKAESLTTVNGDKEWRRMGRMRKMEEDEG
jgi:hypothetical protein